MRNYLYLSAVLGIFLVGCSSSSTTETSDGATDSANNADSVLTGVFLDSAVSGLSYQTESLSGITNELGEFEYVDGENITFSIGSLLLPTVPAEETITPITLSPNRSIEDNTAINIARLLQSLDSDNVPSNGISIPDAASSVSAPADFTVTPDEFTQNTDVINLVANSGSVRTELLNSDIALSHLSSTLGMPDFVRINTRQEFLDQVADRRQNRTGSEDYTFSYSGGTMAGLIGGEVMSGTWYWENGYFCREGQVGADFTFPLDCQILEISGNTLRGTRNQGNGDSVTVVLSEIKNTFFDTRITADNIDSLFDKSLYLHNGEELENNFIVVRSDGTFDGTWNEAPLTGTWQIRDGFWCRVISGSEDCQIWRRTGDTVSGTRAMGTGSAFVYFIIEQ